MVTDSNGEVPVPSWRFGDTSGKQQLLVRIDTIETVLTGFAYDEGWPTVGAGLRIRRESSVYDLAVDARQASLVAAYDTTFHIESASPIDGTLMLTKAYGDTLCIARAALDAPFCMQSSEFRHFQSFAWSPDGRHVLFNAVRRLALPSGGYPYVTLRMDLATRAITPFGTDIGSVDGVDWSPGGSTIAFTRDGAIWIVNTDGSSPTTLFTSREIDVADVRWSPDGEQLALVTYHLNACPWNCDSGLALINRDGSGFRSLLQTNQEKLQALSAPIWSPDGTRIAVAMGNPFERLQRETNVYSVRVGDGTLSRLFDRGVPIRWH